MNLNKIISYYVTYRFDKKYRFFLNVLCFYIQDVKLLFI